MKQRLFWKFLLAFWLALLVVATLAALGGRLLERHDRREEAAAVLEGGPRAALLLDTAQAALLHAGADAMNAMLRDEALREHDLLYVVDERGHDTLGREIPPASLQEARRLTEGTTPLGIDSPHPVQAGNRDSARLVRDASGRIWLMFVAENADRQRRPSQHNAPEPALPAGAPQHDAAPVTPPGQDPAPDVLPEHDMGHPSSGHDGPPPDGRFGDGPARGMPPHDDSRLRHGPPPPQHRPPGAPSPGMTSAETRMLLIAAAIVGSFLFSALLAWSMMRPLRALRQAFDSAARGNLDTRVQNRMGRSRDELTELGAHFDHMVEQIQVLLTSQKRLLHDVSHELRSPLARLQAACDLARQNPARLADSLDRIDREIARLDQLIGHALMLSRLESGATAEEPARFDIGAMLEDIVANADFEATRRGCRVQLARPDGGGALDVFLREELVHRACENVIRNAIKFTAGGSTVDVSLRRAAAIAVRPAASSASAGPAAATPSLSPGQAGTPWHCADDCLVIEVMDRGPGVPPEQLDRIFTPFFRADNSRGVEGYGLGLAIVRQAVKMHGGRISARARDGGGLVMEIILPLCLKETPNASSDGRRPVS